MTLPQQHLRHELVPHYPALRAIRTRQQLLRSPLYAQIGAEIERVLGALEHDDCRGPGAAGLLRPDRIRVAAWNIQRGANLPALRRALLNDPDLALADVLLLVEVDLGMARSGNHNVARELAEALGMRYVFAPSYLVLEDDFGENLDGAPNTLAFHGCAVLARVPILAAENVDVPELRDKFSSSEKRLGKKRALLCALDLPDGPLHVGAVHLDSNASSAQRARQLAAVLQRATERGAQRLLVGGDYNSTTYDASGPLALLRDLLHKFFVTGFHGTVRNYMTPERLYEEPIFATLQAHGLTCEGLNDRSRGTYEYDLNSAYAIEKVRQKVGGLLTRALRRALRRYGGIVPARLDWFAGRGVEALAAGVIHVREPDGRPPSDHSPIYVDLRIGG